MGTGYVLFVAAGGAVGALCRFHVGKVASAFYKGTFPAGTFFVNAVGSFIIGIVSAYLGRGILSENLWVPLVMEGFCGALTTFSSFSADNVRLVREGKGMTACWNIVLSLTACIGAAALGLELAADC